MNSVKEAFNSGILDLHHPVTGQILRVLNPFILSQQLAWHNLEAIKDMHTLKQVIFLDIEQETNPDRLKQLGKDLEQIEFELQRLWGFAEDARYHKFWLYPKCTCPKIDNEDRYATGYCIVDAGCPLHSTDSTSGSGKGV